MSELAAVPPIAALPTSIALFVGWAPSGPVDQALRVKSVADYDRDFGGLDAGALLGYALRHFFGNGGSDAYVLRIIGPNADAAVDPNDPGFVDALHETFAAGGPPDQIARFNLLCVPGLTDPGAIAMLQDFAGQRGAFLIADCAGNDTPTSVLASLAGKTGATAANSALYFPWVVASDPLRNNSPRAFPPSGFVAGIFARTDAQRHVWKAPAGTEASVAGATGLAVHLDDATEQQLNARAVNCLRSFPGAGIVVFGARTLAGADGRAAEWKYVPVRRLASFIEQSVQAGIQWVVFEPNGEPLWSQLRQSVGNFMQTLFMQGAFQGSTPGLGYVVRCDQTTTTQADIDRGEVNIVIGFAALKPGEFVEIRIAQPAGGSR